MVRQVNAPPVSTATIAKRFMADLRLGRRPSIEAALDAGPRAEWGPLLQSLLRAEIDSRRARGEVPVAREYLPRFPAHTEVVRIAFPDPRGEADAAPLPVPLARPVTGPVPKALVLTRKARSTGHRQRRPLMLLAAAPILVVVVAITISLRTRTQNHNASAASPVAPAVGNIASPPAKVVQRPASNDPERDVAEWIGELGGHGTLLLDTGGRRTFGPDMQLPKERFFVTGVTLPPDAADHWLPVDLAKLRGCMDLESLSLSHPTALTDAALEPLVDLPLRSLELFGKSVGVTGITIARFPELQVVTLLNAANFTDADLVAVGRLTELAAFTVNAIGLTPNGLKELRNPLLRSVHLGDRVALGQDHVRALTGLPLEEFEYDGEMTDESLLEFSVIPSLKRIRLHWAPITDEGLKAVVGLGHLEEFRAHGTLLSGSGLEHLTERKGLRILDLSRSSLPDESLGMLLALPELRELRLTGSPITDAGVMFVANLDGLQILDLSGTEITSTGLGILKKHGTLKTLVITNTRVTAAAVREFEKETPNCRVVWTARK